MALHLQLHDTSGLVLQLITDCTWAQLTDTGQTNQYATNLHQLTDSHVVTCFSHVCFMNLFPHMLQLQQHVCKQGFPSTVYASVTYTLTPTNEVIIDFEATSDGATPINMAQHSYFNLEEPSTNKTILDHLVYING